MGHSVGPVYFFAPERVGGQVPGQFVTDPFRSWGNKTQKMKYHPQLDCHMTSVVIMREFLDRYETPSEAVNTMLNSEAHKRMIQNQRVLESLLHNYCDTLWKARSCLTWPS